MSIIQSFSKLLQTPPKEISRYISRFIPFPKSASLIATAALSHNFTKRVYLAARFTMLSCTSCAVQGLRVLLHVGESGVDRLTNGTPDLDMIKCLTYLNRIRSGVLSAVLV